MKMDRARIKQQKGLLHVTQDCTKYYVHIQFYYPQYYSCVKLQKMKTLHLPQLDFPIDFRYKYW